MSARRAVPGARASRRDPRPVPRSVVRDGGHAPSLVGASRWPRDRVALARAAARIGGRPVEIDVEAMGDRRIRALNRRWLSHDWATDVVSFALSSARDPVLKGALAVSVDTARREAARRGHSPYHEWMLYVVHGTLHLLGHDDQASRARARMRRAERSVLAGLGLPDVYGSGGTPRAPGAGGSSVRPGRAKEAR